MFEYSEKRIASIHENFLPSLAFILFAWLSTRNRIRPPFVFHRLFSTVEDISSIYFSLLSVILIFESTRGGFGRVCETAFDFLGRPF